MHRFLFLLPLLCVATPRATAVEQTGIYDIPVETNTIAVRVSANTPELNNLAIEAFRSNGRYSVRGYDTSYDIRFTLVAPARVRVDIARGRETTPAFSETVAGTSGRNALLRAADIAVEKTNGLGLRGYFTARLAFVGEGTGHREIYTSDLFLGEARRLTRDNAPALSPRWSPDGRSILYTGYFRSGFPDIFEIGLNPPRRTTFASFSGTNTGARFSPDGRRVAMILSGTGSTEVWVAAARGGAPVRLTHSDRVKSSPCWSPDGTRIVFAMDPGPQLYVIPSAGGVPQRLYSPYPYTAEPDWSAANPDEIACTVKAGGRFQIALYRFSTGRTAIVSAAPFDGVEPAWLADGRHLIYTARDRRTSVLCILDTQSGRSTTLTSGGGPIGAAMETGVWTPR